MEKYELFLMKCKGCKYEWAKITGSALQDRFVLTSRKEDLASEIKFDSSYFSEISSEVDDAVQTRDLKRINVATIFHEMLGKVSDPAPDGTHYSMMTDYICPKCGSDKISYGPKNPPEFRILDLPELPHTTWDALNDDGKRELIIKSLNNIKVK